MAHMPVVAMHRSAIMMEHVVAYQILSEVVAWMVVGGHRIHTLTINQLSYLFVRGMLQPMEQTCSGSAF